MGRLCPGAEGTAGPAANPGFAHEAILEHFHSRAARSRWPPNSLGLHPGPVRRILALAEGCGAVHRRPSGRGGLRDSGGAGPACQHVELHRRAVLPGPRFRGLSGAPGLCPRGVPPPSRLGRRGLRGRGDGRLGRSALLARPERVRAGPGRRSREHRGDRPARLAHRGGDGHRRDRRLAAHPHRRHRPDGVLRQLSAPPADAPGCARRDGRQPVAGGPRPSGASTTARW